MRILVIGGTRFIGLHFAEAALAAGHEVTVVHRGRSGAGLLPDATHLIADRDAGLATGLALRPVAETARGIGPFEPQPETLTPAREAELLAAWHRR
ncbi:NAD-dependent epimerase/dehydratase family protein [Kitasatospora sp. NPDC091335]|uniref:NAD-dependent epimerase/dehydratase family protein n=1 Tax=Kitasatospora sp. NPDC091335 TaxID=3364085 RepID=UPI0037FF1814